MLEARNVKWQTKCRIQKHPSIDWSRDCTGCESDLAVGFYSNPSRDERRRGQIVIRLSFLEEKGYKEGISRVAQVQSVIFSIGV